MRLSVSLRAAGLCLGRLSALLAWWIPLTAALAVAAAPHDAPEPIRAQVVARHSAVLAAEISAKVDKLPVPEGGAFHAGDTLVAFDSSLQQAQLERARAVLAAAETTATANQRLLALHSIGQVELDLSLTEVEKAKAELAYADAMLAKCRIVAPFSGRIAEARVHEQEFVQPGQALLEIIDDAVPEVDFIAPSKWLAWLKPGLAVQVHIDDTGRSYAAAIERVGAKADPVSQSVKVVAALRQPHAELIPGMSGTVVFSPAAP